MSKRASLIVCVTGIALCLAGVIMIAYSMGVKKTAKEALALNQTASASEASDTNASGAGDTSQQGQNGQNAGENNQSTGGQGGAEDKNQNTAGDKSQNTDDKTGGDDKTGNTDKTTGDDKKQNAEDNKSDGKTEQKDTDKKDNDKKDTDSQGGDKKDEGGQKEPFSGLAVPSECGALAVSGNKLVDKNGNPVQLRGISTHGISWFPTYINQDAFRQFRQEWNVNVMRLAMYTHENGGFCTDGNKEDLKNIIYRGVQYATDNDLYVIIDWHVLQEQNPNTYKDEAKQFFQDMSSRYKDNDNVIYEICNEPNGGVGWSEIKSYAEEVIGVIRSNDEDAVILVGTPNWSQRVDEAAKDPITDYDNIMYTLHFYAATHKDDLRNTMVNAIKGGLPVFVSEYGICDASGNGALDKDSAKKWVDTMNEYGVSYVCWALANKNESAALIKSSCSKNNQFTMDDLSESGKWLYETLTGNTSSGGGNGGGSNDGADTGNNGNNGGGNGNNNNGGAKAQEFQSGGFDCAATLNSSWDADGGKNYQYDLVIKNSGSQSVSSWAIDIHFSSDITLSSSWGGKFTVNGNTLHITSLDYNGKINAGATLKDLGFIIVAPSGLTITD